MRLLALSDIHGNIRAVQQLRARESNRFDVVIVAGDLGDDAAAILSVLASFQCPVLCVYGNWDHELDYAHPFGPNTFHLHTSPYRLGKVAFAGFSGLPAHWGKNPFAESIRSEVADKHRSIVSAQAECAAAFDRAEAEIEAGRDRRVAGLAARVGDRRRAIFRSKLMQLERKRDAHLRKAAKQAEALSNSPEYQAYTQDLDLCEPEIVAGNRRALRQSISESGAAANQTVIVTHERLARTADDLADVPLFLFGHRHGFYDRRFAGSRFVNVSVLDQPVTVRATTSPTSAAPEYRNLNDGNYVVMEGNSLQTLDIRCVSFEPSFDNWEVQPFVIVGKRRADDVSLQAVPPL